MSYTTAAGLNQAQQNMQACLDEAKQADEKQTQIAKTILAA
ncbi:MAG: hypothetical protein ACRYFL_04930 [Janthinobacterium lividum]